MRWFVAVALLSSLTALAARADLVGKIDATFAVAPSGAATYHIPITVPPGTAGMQPSLSLSYDSQGPNGPLGVGFGLGGLSSIGRCASDLGRDGAIRGVRLDRGDRLCLDGERLVAVAGAYGMPGSEYRTERESHARVLALGSADPADPDAGPREFQVFGRDGRIRFYGSSDDARIEAQGSRRVRLWALARVEDRSGNAMRYRYDEDNPKGEFELARIDYTENAAAGLAPYASVRLVWEARPDPESGYFAGVLASTTRRLASLETWFGEERVREYRLGYEANPQTGRSRVATLKLCGLGGECLPETEFGWEQGEAGWREDSDWRLPRHIWTEQGQEGLLADVNADGLFDFVHDGGTGGQSRNTWLNDGTGLVLSTAWRLPDDLLTGFGLPKGLLIDIDGDGLGDYVRSYRPDGDQKSIRTYLNRGSRFDTNPTPGFATPDIMWTYDVNSRAHQLAILIDVNGDELPDWVRAYENNDSDDVIDTRLNTGTGFGSASATWRLPRRLWSHQGDKNKTQAALTDLNADGLPDLIQAYEDNSTGAHKGVWLNTGSGFSGPVSAWQPPAIIWDYNGDGVEQKSELADLNADGLPDFVVAFQSNGGGFTLETYLNTGASWLRAPQWDLPSPIWTYTGAKNRQLAQLVDVNGDGYPDLVRAYTSAPGEVRTETWLNTRSGFPSSPEVSLEYAAPAVAWNYEDNVATSRSTFADLDGDGTEDMIKAYLGGSVDAHTYLGKSTAGDRIEAITDGLGGLVRIEYLPLTDKAVYSVGPRAPYPKQSIVDARRVVRRFGAGATPQALRFTSFRYSGLQIDRLRRLNLGFGSREARDESSGVVVTEFSRQDWPMQGLADSTVRSASDGTVIARSQDTYQLGTGSPPGVNAILPIATAQQTFELDGTPVAGMRTQREFDRFGNATLETSTWDDGNRTTVRMAFDVDESRWLIAQARRLETGAAAPGMPEQTRVGERSFDPVTGRVLREVREPDRDELRLEHVYSYDAFGNPIAIETRGFGIQPRAELMFFDPRGQGVVLELNALGQSRRSEPDPRLGVPLVVFGPDPDLPPARISYDALGRVISTTRPDGVTTTTTRERCDESCPAEASTVVRSSAPGRGAVSSFKDGLGRDVRSESPGFDGRLVRIDTQYDLRGNVARRSRPYYSDEAPQYTEYERDELDRPIRVQSPDASLTTYAYAARRVTITDPLLHVCTEIHDMRGALIEKIDPEAGHTYFAVNGFGQVESVRDPAGNQTRSTFDRLGRRTRVDDPDLGTSRYAYDALGQQVTATDARGTETRFSYDVLGRLVRRQNDSAATLWTWDVARNGVGRIARVESLPNGSSREESYDRFGRPSASTTRVGGSALRLQRLYDSFGRIARVSYPDGFAVTQSYAPSGQLASVRSAINATVFWRAESRIADGRVERERLGNGLRTDRMFDPRTGRLRQVLTGSDSAAEIQSLAYAWDAGGNLQARSDWNSGVSEIFDYDRLDRLQRATSPALGTVDLRYDPTGNLIYKSGPGAYSYPAPGSARPHAVVAAGTRAFSYDANGNMTADGAGRQLVWSANNELLASGQTGPDGAFEFLGYGPEGELQSRLEIDASATGSSTYVVQVADLFESATDLKTGRVEQRHMIYAEGALVAVHTTSNQGPAETVYVHRDHVESVNALSDSTGSLVERVSYDPHGAVRRGPLGADDPATLLRVAPRGYTGAVQLRRSQLVHLRGRVYDPALGRFLSPDPVTTTADPQSLNRYAYARNNPLRFVDPSGYLSVELGTGGFDAGLSFSTSAFAGTGFPALPAVPATAADARSGALSSTTSFLQSSWNGIRFAVSAMWNGIGWLGETLWAGARWAGSMIAAGAEWLWDTYNALDYGILPDKYNPGGIFQSIWTAFAKLTWPRENFSVERDDSGRTTIEEYDGPLSGKTVFYHGQMTNLDQDAEAGLGITNNAPFILSYLPTTNLFSDTLHSLLLKVIPPQAAFKDAAALSGAKEGTRLIGFSQGTLYVYWIMFLARGQLSNVKVDFVGPAASNLAYQHGLARSGASPGPLGYVAHLNDPVPTLFGGNYSGGLLLPLLLPLRFATSAVSVPLLGVPAMSPHHYP